MVITACQCNWSIPGLRELPAHSHYTERHVRRNSSGEIMVMKMSHWIQQPGFTVVAEFSEINVWVDWKAVARALTTVKV